MSWYILWHSPFRHQLLACTALQTPTCLELSPWTRFLLAIQREFNTVSRIRKIVFPFAFFEHLQAYLHMDLYSPISFPVRERVRQGLSLSSRHLEIRYHKLIMLTQIWIPFLLVDSIGATLIIKTFVSPRRRHTPLPIVQHLPGNLLYQPTPSLNFLSLIKYHFTHLKKLLVMTSLSKDSYYRLCHSKNQDTQGIDQICSHLLILRFITFSQHICFFCANELQRVWLFTSWF